MGLMCELMAMEGGYFHGQADFGRRTVGVYRGIPAAAKAAAVSVSGTSTAGRSGGVDRHSLCAEDGHSVGGSAPGDGLWIGDDVLAPVAGLAARRGVGKDPPRPVGTAARGRQDRLLAGDRGQRLRAGGFGGAKVGPNPTDRGKNGSKHHVITDGNGIPLAAMLTGANRNDVTQLLPLVDAIPPIAGHVGHPRFRPDRVQGDRGYDSAPHRRALRARGIIPVLGRRLTPHGSGLGVYRWVVERTLSWLHQFRRLRIRWERRADIHEAFLTLGCIRICHRCLEGSFC